MTARTRISLIMAGVITAGLIFAGWQWYRGQQARSYTPDQLIRFHVIANSDSAADQALKLHVRDVIVQAMAPRFQKAADIDQARQIARENLGLMRQLAAEEIHREGKNYPVKVYLGHFLFPTKTYHLAAAGNQQTSLTLPAGEYEAVRVVIGRGAGHNWWCVLFPPLCFVDVPAGQPAPGDNANKKRDVPQDTTSVCTENGQVKDLDSNASAFTGRQSGGVNKPETRKEVPAFKIDTPVPVVARSPAPAKEEEAPVQFRWRIVDALHDSSQWLARLFG